MVVGKNAEGSLYSLRGDMTEPARSLLVAAIEMDEFLKAEHPDERLKRLQRISDSSRYLPDDALRSLAVETLQDEDPRIRGEMCYALGRSERPYFASLLQLLEDDSDPWVRKQARAALRMLEKATSVVPSAVSQALTQFAEPGSIQSVAASQMSLLISYYNGALKQARTAFRWAVVAAGMGFLFFLGAAAFLLTARNMDSTTIGIAAIGCIGGIIGELAASIQFFRYKKSTMQVAHIYQRIHQQADPSQMELEQAIQRVEEEPEKAKPAWDLARLKLESYFDRNLGQIKHIFWLSVGVMIAGFVVIVLGFILSLLSTSVRPSIALVGGIAGVLTEFIAATFMFIYRSANQQAADYVKTLERINSVGMAMQIMDTISDDSEELQDRTKAAVAKMLLSQTDGG
jgi:hypothetical protein